MYYCIECCRIIYILTRFAYIRIYLYDPHFICLEAIPCHFSENNRHLGQPFALGCMFRERSAPLRQHNNNIDLDLVIHTSLCMNGR